MSQKIRENQYPGAPKQPRLLRGVPMEIWLVETATIISGIAALIYIVQVSRPPSFAALVVSKARSSQGTPRPEIKRKVDWAAGLLGIDRLLQRRPRQLSGGERQRVALARALVRNPTVFLLDEPLSNLDAKLRASARSELKQFQQKVGTTTIYVTHDQVEAMGMGDRIAVIDHGKLRQIGAPSEIYDRPADDFVASFLGTPPMNLVEHGGGFVGFRPEHFLPREMLDGAALSELPFRIDRMEYLGSERILYGALDGVQAKREVTAKLPAHIPLSGIHTGEWHKFAVREANLRYFDQDGRRTVSPKEQAR